MRGVLVSLAFVSAVVLMAPSKTTASPVSTSLAFSTVALQEQVVPPPERGSQPPQQPPPDQPQQAQPAPDRGQAPSQNIDITVGDRATTGWYRNPVWIAIGALAAFVVVLLIVMLARGSDTTVIHE